ncbi:MAG: hypothetical protein HFH50_00595 [Lachnospiraceae bacterium]|nr:hypothetical protein [Lachnospiraceae bacterium]
MENQDGMERELSLMELFWNILFSWRQVICFGVIGAIALGGIKYVRDSRTYNAAQNVPAQEEIVLTPEEEEQVKDAQIMIERVEDYEKYLDTSALMQINPYEKPVMELQYYVESDYTYNYTQDNQTDYTGDLMSLYYNYIRSGEMSNKIIASLELPVSQADFSELCGVSQLGRTMVIIITWNDEGMLEKISNFIKTELTEMEASFQEVGSHKLKLLRESHNVVADTELAEKKNVISNNITYINTQLNALKATMTEQQLAKLREETGMVNDNDTEVLAAPGFNIKYIMLGAIGGIFIICIWIACRTIFTVKLQNSEEIRTLYKTRLLGEIAVMSKKKRFLSIIDEKLLAIKNRKKKKLSVEQQIKVVAANVALSCKQQKIERIYITGSEYESLDSETLDLLKREIRVQNIQVAEGGSIFYDAESLKQGTEIGNMLFVEQIGRSIYDEISNELNLAREQKNNILGVLVLGEC